MALLRHSPGASLQRMLLLLCLLVCGPSACVSLAADENSRTAEARVKAVFLLNFASFVEWPPNSFETGSGDFVICLYGDDPLKEELEKVLEGEKVKGRRLKVRYASTPAAVDGSHLVFVGKLSQRQLQELVTNLRGKPTLTVSDGRDFAAAGGMIQFVTVRGRLRFQISQEAAQLADLKISSKLLRLAEPLDMALR